MVARLLSSAGSTIVFVLVCALPWFFGGKYFGTQSGTAAALLVALAAVCVAWRTTGAAWLAVRLPLACLIGGIALGFGQLTATAERRSPRAAELRREFAAPVDAASGAVGESPLSVHPPATRRDLALLIAATAAFLLGAALFADTKPLLRLMIVLTVAGAAVACYGLALRAGGGPWLYFGMSPPINSAPFGPFVGRNYAAGFLNICLAASVGVFLSRIGKMSPRHHGRRRESALNWLLRNLDAPLLASATAVVVLLAGIVGSLSRGGLVATALGGVAALVMISVGSRHQIYYWSIALGVAIAVGLVVWLGEGAALESRWVRLLQGGLANEDRLKLWSEALEASDVYRWLGSGLGTFYYAHAPFQRHGTLGLYVRGENQYVEALVVGGYLGLALLILLGLCCLSAVRRLLKHAETGDDLAIAGAGAALLLPQAIAACFDFGWFLPSLFVPLAAWCGALVKRAADVRRRNAPRRRRRSSSPPTAAVPTAAVPTAAASVATPDASRVAPNASLSSSSASSPRTSGGSSSRPGTAPWVLVVVVALLGGGLVAGLAWGTRELRRAMIVAEAERSSRPLVNGEIEPTLAQLNEASDVQRRAVEACPDDAEARVRLAELLIAQFVAAGGGDVARLAATANLATRIGDEQSLSELRSESGVRTYLRPALEEVRHAIDVCPFNFYAQMPAARLCFVAEPPTNELHYLKCAERLAQGRADWLLAIGAAYLDAAEPDRAWACWKRSWTLRIEGQQTIWSLARGYLSAEQALNVLVPDNPEVIVEIARTKLNDESDAVARRAYYAKALQLLHDVRRKTGRHEFLRGLALAGVGKLEDAEQTISGSLREPDAQGAWYFDLAAVRAALDMTQPAETAYERYRLLVEGAPPPESYFRAGARLVGDLEEPTFAQRRLCGQLYLRAGAGEPAADAFRGALAIRADDAEATGGLAEALLLLGDAEAAVVTAERAVALDPPNDKWRKVLADAQAAAAAKKAQP